LNSSSQPRLAVGCRIREGEDGPLLVPEGVLRLKGTAIDVLRLCDGQRTYAEILLEMQGRYQSADAQQMEREIESFLNRLQQRRVIDF
jgi:pyrroloquinoline quinone biosynthesis protein D